MMQRVQIVIGKCSTYDRGEMFYESGWFASPAGMTLTLFFWYSN